ncbi:helix-turn-helix domain-containing protein [Nocardia sp. NPDC005366]|uniref:TetR/AcrR family transcriptional regulator n=1 Tax=Nocardia sp. NPDC005366 TaxID=3156878 RepID=UPI00339F8650
MSGLREQKKLAAWRALRSAALRLFEERGYEATTVDQIAAAAGVSRATFFNYFVSKEAVVFDPDPEERKNWIEVMRGRADGEPLWDSLTVVLLAFIEALRDRMPLQRKLKQRSPSLAQSTHNLGELFRNDLHEWALSRPGAEQMSTVLQLNLALAATATAYQTWGVDASFDDYLVLLRRCLDLARPGGLSPDHPPD